MKIVNWYDSNLTCTCTLGSKLVLAWLFSQWHFKGPIKKRPVAWYFSWIMCKATERMLYECFISLWFVVWRVVQNCWTVNHCCRELEWFVQSEAVIKRVLRQICINIRLHFCINTNPCVFNINQITYPYFLAYFYNTSQFDMINFTIVNIYSVICLFRNAVVPEEKFELDRVRITGSFMFSLRG